MNSSSSSSSSTDEGLIFNRRSKHFRSRSTQSPRDHRHKIILTREQYLKVMRFLSRDNPPPQESVVVNLTRREINYIQTILESDDP